MTSRLVLQLCAVTAVSALMAGCSSDSTRLSDPLGNPFNSSSNEPVRHLASNDGIPAGRTPPVTSRALAAPQAVASVAPLRPNLTRSAAMQPISRETTGSIDPGAGRAVRGNSYGGWTSSGGVPITVGEGETVDVISKRYGVPATALLQTNGYASPSDVHAGTSLTIPVYSAVAASHVAAAAPVMHTATVQQRPERVAAVAPAPVAPAPVEPKAGPRKAVEKVARAEPKVVAPKVEAKAQPVLKAPAAKVAEAAPAKVQPRKGDKPEAAPAAAPVKTALAKPVAPAAKPAPATKPAPAVAQAAPVAQPKVAEAAPAAVVADASGNPEFRWPARGRIIQGFKGGNDGINIALPDGTPIKAAEGGTVAYSGSELKGYGNLVLIRHPNGFVTAYANNGELDVKRGDTVKRGQVIAKSGQSGNVSSPQLHFELRKGSTPVDPTTYLAGL